MKTTQKVILDQHGDADVLNWKEQALPDPGANEVHIEHQAIGINFVEIYYRSGIYPLTFPSGLGSEATGIVTALGKDVQGFKIGDRVGYCTGPLGSYAEARCISTDFLIKLPDSLSFVDGAALMLKGLTTQYLLRQTHPVSAGETLLVFAAAGGVGLLMGQWAKQLGAKTIGVVGSAQKKDLAIQAGYDEVLVGYEGIPEQVRSITNGRGVDVVYDSVGKSTFMTSLDSLRPRGLLVSFGNASGEVDPFPVNLLARKGGLYVTRPSLGIYANTPSALRSMSQEMFEHVSSGHIKILESRTLPFSEVQRAHKELADRKTLGSTVLVPN